MKRPVIWAVLTAAFLATMAVSALAVDFRAGVIASAVAGIVTAICALGEGIAGGRRGDRTIASAGYSLSALMSGLGFGSWFLLQLGAINLAGVIATLAGTVGLLMFGLRLADAR